MASERLSRRAAWALLLMAASGGAISGWTLGFSTQITHFLPKGEESAESALSAVLADSELTRTLILAVEAKERGTAIKAAKAIRTTLGAHREVAWIRSGVEPALTEAVGALYMPRSLMLISDQPEGTLTKMTTDAGLRASARALKAQLSSPMGSLARAVAPKDPFLGFVAQLERLQAARGGGLKVFEEQFVSKDERHAIIFLGTVHSAFQSGFQRKLLVDIEGAFESLRSSMPGLVRLRMGGVHRFAVASEASIKSDVARISILSTIGVLLLFFTLFRSLKYLALSFLPVLMGFSGAMIACRLVFSEIHGITLAFGGAMIGVCVDYSVHLLAHYTLAGEDAEPARVMKTVWPGILLGGSTTIAGVLGLAWTTFPGIQEIAVFASAGVASALFTARWILPPLLPARPERSPFQQRWAERAATALQWVATHRAVTAVVFGLALALSAAGLPRLTWVDALSALNQLDPQMLKEDQEVRAMVSKMEGGQLALVSGATEEEALARNDVLFHTLVKLRASGAIDDFRSLHSVLWSEGLQRRNLKVLAAQPQLASRLDAAFVQEGFQSGAFAAFEDALKAHPAPLTFAELMASPLASMVRPFRAELNGRVLVFSFLRAVHQPELVREAVGQLSGATYFDQRAFLDGAYGEYRRRALQLVALGLGLVFLLVLVRYRSLRLALAAFLPAVVAALGTLGLVGVLGLQANLMHIVALLLVLSIGVDYGVFMVEHRNSSTELSATMLSIAVACLTTIFSFGVLAMSSNPALTALGLAVGTGVLFALLLAPAALVLLGRGE